MPAALTCSECFPACAGRSRRRALTFVSGQRLRPRTLAAQAWSRHCAKEAHGQVYFRTDAEPLQLGRVVAQRPEKLHLAMMRRRKFEYGSRVGPAAEQICFGRKFEQAHPGRKKLLLVAKVRPSTTQAPAGSSGPPARASLPPSPPAPSVAAS
jgi:hypothetical protein